MIINAKCKKCRRAGQKLFLKGERCFSQKCAMIRRPYPPGVHGKSMRRRASEYGLQLAEKQKVRYAYGISEQQFKKYFKEIVGQKGNKEDLFAQKLESRLDNVVFRLSWAGSRALSRQLVNHGHILVNGRKVDIPSYRVKPGQKIEIREKSKQNPQIVRAMELTAQTGIVPWVDVEKEKLFGIFTRLPEREEVVIPVEERLIVELYSK